MARLTPAGGSQVNRSPIANFQRCINLYPEVNAKDSPTPITFYQRPGMKPLVAGNGEVRGFYWCDCLQQAFVAIGAVVYLLVFEAAPGGGPAASLTPIGSLASSTGPVSFQDNRITLLIADGTAGGGWTYDVSGGGAGWAVYNDPTGSYQGTHKFVYLDTFILWACLGRGNTFYSTLSNETTVDPTYVATLSGQPDNLVTIEVNHRYLFLFGTYNTEIWFDAANPAFPFAEVTGLFIPHGCWAVQSVASMDLSIYWLSQNHQGQRQVLRCTNFSTTKISDHALDWALANAEGDCSDARGFTFSFLGHLFYLLTLPSEGQTWVFDEATQHWHQWMGTTAGGNCQAHTVAYVGGLLLAGDTTGTVFLLDKNTYTDNNQALPFVRGLPHLVSLEGPNGPMACEGRRVTINRLRVDISAGGALIQGQDLIIRYSSDRGYTWGSDVLVPAGNPGAYATRPQLSQIGMSHDFVFELEWTFAGEVAVNGFWVEGVIGEQGL